MKNTLVTPSVQYESMEAALMYLEFLSPPNNPFFFVFPDHYVVSLSMVQHIIRTAHHTKSYDYVDN